jgi:hypothetical protein
MHFFTLFALAMQELVSIDWTTFFSPICIGNTNLSYFFALIGRVLFPQFALAMRIFYDFCVGNAIFFGINLTSSFPPLCMGKFLKFLNWQSI